MKRLTPTQIRQAYDQGPDAVVDLVTQLFDIIGRLESEVHALKSRVPEWERQVHRNSHNSSQPSVDGFKKPPPKSQGRPGHPGETLKAWTPSNAIRWRCVRNVGNRSMRRQVVDIRPLPLTEHQAEVKACPTSITTPRGSFPPMRRFRSNMDPGSWDDPRMSKASK